MLTETHHSVGLVELEKHSQSTHNPKVVFQTGVSLPSQTAKPICRDNSQTFQLFMELTLISRLIICHFHLKVQLKMRRLMLPECFVQ